MGEMLKDRVAVVTGAARGMGRGVAPSLAVQGAKVLLKDYPVNTDGSAASAAPAQEGAARFPTTLGMDLVHRAPVHQV